MVENIIYYDVVEDIFGNPSSGTFDLCDIQVGLTGIFSFLFGQCFHVRGHSFGQQGPRDFVEFQLTVHVPQSQIDVRFRATFFQDFFIKIFGKNFNNFY